MPPPEILQLSVIEQTVDPLIGYRHVEDEISAEYASLSPQTFWDWSSLVLEAPHKHLKATSNLGDSLHLRSVQEVIRAQCDRLAHAIFVGQDIKKDARAATQMAEEVAQSQDISLSSFHDLATLDGNVVGLLRQAFPRFHMLDKTVQVALTNHMFAERLRVHAEEKQGKEDDLPKQEELHSQENTLTISLTPPLQYLIDQLSSPAISPLTLQNLARFIETYALHMPIKITSEGENLTLEGIIRQVMVKISEGICEGKNLLETSRKRMELAEKVVRDHPYLQRQYGGQMQDWEKTGIPEEDARQLQVALPNYLLCAWMRRQAEARIQGEASENKCDGDPLNDFGANI